MKTLALLGSGEYTDAMLEVDRYLLTRVDKPRVALLATAAAQEHDWNKWVEMGITHFKKLGLNAEEINLLTRKDAEDPELAKKLGGFNFYYFSGGDPGYLLNTLKNTACWEVIKNNYESGSVLAGSSAGAMAFGSMTWTSAKRFFDSSDLTPWEPGLGMAPFGVIPHYDAITSSELKKEEVDKIFNALPTDTDIIGIDEDTAYIFADDEWKVMGSGGVHGVQKK